MKLLNDRSIPDKKRWYNDLSNSLPQKEAMAGSIYGFKGGLDRFIEMTPINHGSGVMISKWDHHVQKSHISGYQLLRDTTVCVGEGGGLLPSYPSCMASWKHLVHLCVVLAAGLDRIR